MSNLFKGLLALLVVGFVASCSSAPEGEKVKAEEKQEVKAATGTDFTVNAAESFINWTGVGASSRHTGDIKMSNGTLTVQDGNITGGSFMIDMNSINCTDLEGDKKSDLEGHLKTGDFFEVEKFPTGKFEIVKVEPVSDGSEITHNITGNLTMKDMTKSVTIPANVAVSSNAISAVTPSFTIDRTEWGITYNSGTLASTVKERLINDEIGLVINLKAAASMQ